MSNAALAATDSAESLALTQLCDLCWQKIDEFNQFYLNVERIQFTYERHFVTATGDYLTFNDSSQYFIEVEKIYKEFARNVLNGTPTEEKKFSIEPFCVINVDESASLKVAPEDVDQQRSSVDGAAVREKELLMSSEIKEELAQIPDEPITADVLNVDENLDALSNGDGDEVDDYDDDESEYGNESESDDSERSSSSSDTSDEEIDEKQRKGSNGNSSSSAKPTKQMKTAKKRSDSENRSSHRRRSAHSASNKHGKKISVTTVNILDENNRRLLSYVKSVMKCDKCSDDRMYDSFAEIQTHFLDTHQQTGYIICCNRKFRRIGRVLQHCTWHDNPEAFKCDTCNKCFQDNVCLRDHITSMHIPADERRFQCEQCKRLFAKQHLLNTHLKMKHTVKEERPFVCTEGECGQRFVLPAYLRLHIEKVHNKSDSR